ncbi:class I SAM-dependent methyltransferase [Flavobacterium sp.]|uniref:class I SAM-dependent methyltransferase n=1 Tax=Flavobacterium sp. TaxID=239 RepID=UPI003752FA0A
MLSKEAINAIVHPKTKAKFINIESEKILFSDGSFLPIYNGAPLLLSDNSIFKIEDITSNKFTTQDADFVKPKSFKNHFRKKILPSLVEDFHIRKRYAELGEKVNKTNGKVLIIGAGDKVDYYKSLFASCEVIASDVHIQLQADCVIDAHEIPFEDGFFDLVFAAQVIEHTMNPWLLAQEFQRVTKIGGYIQIEAPQNYPYHGQPYDFFRFTFTGLRSLFNQCALEKTYITEGNASMVAVTIANYIVNLTSHKHIRRISILGTRLLFGWFKYFDNFKVNKRTLSSPKGYAMTFVKDAKHRFGEALFEEFFKLRE